MQESLVFAVFDDQLHPLDDECRKWIRKYGEGELVIFGRPKVKNRDATNHRKMMLLFQTAFNNQPEDLPGVQYYNTFDTFRRAWTLHVGFVEVYKSLDGGESYLPRSLAYDNMIDDDVDQLRAALVEGFCKVYGPEWSDALLMEVQRMGH